MHPPSKPNASWVSDFTPITALPLWLLPTSHGYSSLKRRLCCPLPAPHQLTEQHTLSPPANPATILGVSTTIQHPGACFSASRISHKLRLTSVGYPLRAWMSSWPLNSWTGKAHFPPNSPLSSLSHRYTLRCLSTSSALQCLITFLYVNTHIFTSFNESSIYFLIPHFGSICNTLALLSLSRQPRKILKPDKYTSAIFL